MNEEEKEVKGIMHINGNVTIDGALYGKLDDYAVALGKNDYEEIIHYRKGDAWVIEIRNKGLSAENWNLILGSWEESLENIRKIEGKQNP